MTRKMWRLVAIVGVLALFLTACPRDEEAADPGASPGQDQTEEGTDEPGDAQDERSGGTLQTVLDRGELNCGVNETVPGFGIRTEEGEFEGFDPDFCRAIAAALFGDAEAVSFTPLTVETRFTALQAREVDVLIRNTTWTATRDGAEGATFAPTTFYDGQGMMVRADSGFGSLDDMGDTTVCVLSGTTTELNLETGFRQRDLDYEALTFEDTDTLREAFLQERCDGWTSDKSQLAAFRAAWPEDEGGPEALQVLDETMSKEPLGPVTLDGDDEWSDVVNWVVIATIQAEEFGINSENIDEFMETSPDEAPAIARFLGIEEFDPGLELPSDFAEQIIRQVGNYGEIFERNIGPDTPLGLERDVNNIWTEGGLLYPPPFG